MTALRSDYLAPIASDFLDRWWRENFAKGQPLFLQVVPTGKTRIEVKATASASRLRYCQAPRSEAEWASRFYHTRHTNPLRYSDSGSVVRMG
jgi:hypothetical protein